MRTNHGRRSARRGALRSAFFVLLGSSLLASSPSAETTSTWTSSESWDGLSEFSRLAARRIAEGKLVLTSTLPLSELTANDSVIVMMPEVRLETDSLTRFLADGGRLAVLDDYGTSGPLLERFSIRLAPAPLQPRERIRDSAALPIASPPRESPDTGRHPLAEGVDKVVTNHPRVLLHPHLSNVLGIVDAKGDSHSVAITGVVAGKGRLVVVSDPSIFINWMLRYPDNRRFAANLLEALGAGAPNGKVWFVSGVFAQTGHYGETSWLEQLSKALAALAELRKEVEEDGLPSPLALGLALFAFFALFSLEVLPNLRRPGERPPLFSRGPTAEPPSLELGRKLALVAARENLEYQFDRIARNAAGGELTEQLARVGLDAGEIAEFIALRAALSGELPRRSPRTSETLQEKAQRFAERFARAPRMPS